MSALAAGGCREVLHTLDVAGCVGISDRTPDGLRSRLLALRCFLVHS